MSDATCACGALLGSSPGVGRPRKWSPTLDHIACQAWDPDPDHTAGNLRLAHHWCNSVRSDGRLYQDSEFASAAA